MKKMYWYGRSGLERYHVPYFRGTVEHEESVIPREMITFDSNYTYYGRKDLKVHRLSLPDAVRFTTQNTCTPPLLFLQSAGEYSVIRQILLGYQLCAYRENQKPLSTLKRLVFCAETLAGHPGRVQTLRALKYVREGSRSPMESIFCMFLTLPHQLGGMGIKEIQLNVPVKTAGKTFYADIYIPNENLVIEYNSFSFHNNSTSFSKDSERVARIESAGYRVLSVKTEQLFDINEFTVLMKYLHKIMGKRIQIRSPGFIRGFAELRALMTKRKDAFQSSGRMICLNELPKFSGMRALHKLYVEELRREKRKRNEDETLLKK